MILLGSKQDIKRVWGIGALGFGRSQSYQVRPLLLLVFVSDMVAQVLKFPLVFITAALEGFTNTQFIFLSAWEGFNFTLLFWRKFRRVLEIHFITCLSALIIGCICSSKDFANSMLVARRITPLHYQSEDRIFFFFFCRPHAFPFSIQGVWSTAWSSLFTILTLHQLNVQIPHFHLLSVGLGLCSSKYLF